MLWKSSKNGSAQRTGFKMSVSKTIRTRGAILDEIMRYHREQLPKIKRQVPISDLRALAGVAPKPLDFYASLRAPGVSLIAECKKASPSKGLLIAHYDPGELAKTYAAAGARAISVLTDGRHFQGSLDDLQTVKRVAIKNKGKHGKLDPVPVLRKDFIFDPYQVYESRVAGADALLLIAAVLSDNAMRDLIELTRELGMAALIEVHTREELDRVLSLNPRIIGINNRNLQTFEVDFENTARLRQLIPSEVIAVGESGIKTAADVHQMAKIGIDAILVGESLVKSKNTLNAAREFVEAGIVGSA